MKIVNNCKEVQDLFGRYIDNELGSEHEKKVEIHIEKCVKCYDELDLLKKVDTAGKMEIWETPAPCPRQCPRKGKPQTRLQGPRVGPL